MALQCIFSLLVFLLSTCTATPMVKSPNIPLFSPYQAYSPYNVAPPPAAVPTTTVGTQTTSTVPMNTVGARTQVISTCGGSAKGAPCVFPFTYKGIMYTKCTPIDHDEPWCSTESVYESQWGNCNCPGASPKSNIATLKPNATPKAKLAWKLLFRQSDQYLSPASRWLSVNPNDPNNPNYSILNALGKDCIDDKGKFQFKLVWPKRTGANYNVWRQSTNPVTQRKTQVQGYESVDVKFTSMDWGGLESGYLRGGSHPHALLDGSVNHGNWYYAVGTRVEWQGGIPGALEAETQVELYAMCKPGNMCACANGTPVSGVACSANGASMCRSCQAGYTTNAEKTACVVTTAATTTTRATTAPTQVTNICNGEETKSGPCVFKVTYRDFQAARMTNTAQAPNVFEKYIPDFEASTIRGNYHRAVNGLLKNTLNKNHKPELSDQHSQMTSPETFAAWFDECAGPAGPGLTCGPTKKTCAKRQMNGIPCGYSYRFDSFLRVNYDAETKKYSLKNNNHFLPLSNRRCPKPLVNSRCGWGDQPARWGENYAFTTEMNLLFKFKGGENFQFTGDDDFWVFIGSRLAVDIGGLHSPLCKTLKLPEPGCKTCEGVVKFCNGVTDYTFDASYLKVGQIYRFDLFHAERHSTGSNFNFETTLDLKEDTCKDFLQQLKAGTYTSSQLHPGLLVTDESCPTEKFEFEESTESSFCDIRKCRPGYEAVGSNYLRLVCDGEMLRSYGKGFRCSKITASTSTTPSGSTTSITTVSTITTTTVTSETTKPSSSTTTQRSSSTTTEPSSDTSVSSKQSSSTTPRAGSTTTSKGVNTDDVTTDNITTVARRVVNSGTLLSLSSATVVTLSVVLNCMI